VYVVGQEEYFGKRIGLFECGWKRADCLAITSTLRAPDGFVVMYDPNNPKDSYVEVPLPAEEVGIRWVFFVLVGLGPPGLVLALAVRYLYDR